MVLIRLDISKFGHIDHCTRIYQTWFKPIDAITMASKNNFDYYNMGKDLGGIAPGKLADILIFNDLKSFKPNKYLLVENLLYQMEILLLQSRKKQFHLGLKIL